MSKHKSSPTTLKTLMEVLFFTIVTSKGKGTSFIFVTLTYNCVLDHRALGCQRKTLTLTFEEQLI